MSNVRQEAVRNIACTRHNLNRVDFKKTHVKDLFGINVFNDEVQRTRLPKPIYKALCAEEARHGFGQTGGGGFRDGAVTFHPPRRRRAGREQDHEAGRQELFAHQ